MTTRRSSVYLSGWEYNRLLQPDPTQPKISALPAAILWNGSHQLWMFKTIYCARESFENEIEASDRLGWVNGIILRDLYNHDREIFQTIDWTDLPAEAKDRLRIARAEALSILPEQSIRRAIEAGDAGTLELAKLTLLEPILDHYGCFDSGAPNSVTNWFKPGAAPQETGRRAELAERQELAYSKLENLARVVMPGMDLCRPPGTGVSKEARDQQRDAQEAVEKPMIPSLLAGEGEFEGAHGFVPYLRKLERVKGAYQATNEQLRGDWEANKDNLFRLREAASRYLWDDLHGYWLPRLLSLDEADRNAGSEFDHWVRGAMRIPSIFKYLHGRATTVLVGAFGSSALAAALAHAGVPFPDAVVSGGLAGAAAFTAKSHLDQMARLALFFQDARHTPA